MPGRHLGHRDRRGVREAVALPGDEAVEDVLRVQSRVALGVHPGQRLAGGPRRRLRIVVHIVVHISVHRAVGSTPARGSSSTPAAGLSSTVTAIRRS